MTTLCQCLCTLHYHLCIVWAQYTQASVSNDITVDVVICIKIESLNEVTLGERHQHNIGQTFQLQGHSVGGSLARLLIAATNICYKYLIRQLCYTRKKTAKQFLSKKGRIPDPCIFVCISPCIRCLFDLFIFRPIASLAMHPLRWLLRTLGGLTILAEQVSGFEIGIGSSNYHVQFITIFSGYNNYCDHKFYYHGLM